jgi:hypothetical protein
MNKPAAATILLLAALQTTYAHGDVKCNVAKEEMRPQMELQKKLQAEGWKVRMIQLENGCYEVYAFDAAQQRVEVFFNPKTFEQVGRMK